MKRGDFDVVVMLETVGQKLSFVEAYMLFYKKLLEQIKSGANEVHLKRSSHMTYFGQFPVMTDDINAFALKIGLLRQDGTLAEDFTREPSPVELLDFFGEAYGRNLQNAAQWPSS